MNIMETMDEIDKLFIQLNNEEKEYDTFYKAENTSILINNVYINKDNSIEYIKQNIHKLEDGYLRLKDINKVIDKNKKKNNINYGLYKLLQYNITLDPRDLWIYLKNPDKYNFLKECNNIDDIKWGDSIILLQEINSLYILFREKNINKHNKTKKIYITIKNKKLKGKYTRKKV